MEDNKLVLIADKKMPNLLRVTTLRGGSVPDILKGLYSGYSQGMKAINAYNSTKLVHKPMKYKGENEQLVPKTRPIKNPTVENGADDGKKEKSKNTDKVRAK